MRIVGQPFRIPGRGGWYLRWTDPVTKKRVAKAFPQKSLAEQYRAILIYKFNSDVYIGAIAVPLNDAIEEYLKKYDLRGLSNNSKVDAQATLKRFAELIGYIDTKRLDQRHFDAYILKRKEGLSPYTLNKDIGNLKAFIGWARNQRYITADITLHKVKVSAPNRKALTTDQIRYLFRRCPTSAWRCRILLSLVTGLRAGDIDSLNLADLDLKRASINTESRKTGKAYYNRPLPKDAIPELDSYVKGLPKDQIKLFGDRNIRREWRKITGKSGITRQDLRRTFATLIQSASSIETARDLLEHYSSRTTEDFYTDKELLIRIRVERLPVKDWLT